MTAYRSMASPSQVVFNRRVGTQRMAESPSLFILQRGHARLARKADVVMPLTPPSMLVVLRFPTALLGRRWRDLIVHIDPVVTSPARSTVQDFLESATNPL